MNDHQATTAHALRVVGLLLAIGAVGRLLTEDASGDLGRQLFVVRAATALLALVLAALSGPDRSARTLRILAIAIGFAAGGGAIGVLVVAPSTLLEQAIVIVGVMLAAALFVPWSWRWQAALAAALVLATAAALPRVPSAPQWDAAHGARMLFTITLLGVAGVIGAGLADRERRRLTASEARYRGLFYGAGDAIAVLDPAGVIREGNPRLAELLGEPLDRLLGRPLSDFYASDSEGPAPPDHTAALGGGVHAGARVLLRGDGRRVEVDATFARADSPGGAAVQAILHDLTDQRSAERRHEQQQRLSALASFAGGLAHQFNNLLAGILTHASVLRAEAGQATLQGELDEILAAARRGRDLVRELLRFTRNEPTTLRPTAPGDVLTGVAELARVTVPGTVTLDVRVPDGLPLMAADADHLVHACLELVLNARDALRGQGDGRIALAAALETVEPDDARWPGAAAGRYVRLSVSDTGVGMDRATLDRVFEPFFTTQPMHQAVGMGLPRVYRVARDHHGWVRIDSARRRGTTVDLLVPVAEGAAAPATPPAAAAPRPAPVGQAQTPPTTVLVVDDEEIVRTSLTRALRRMGYQVLAAWDGPTALSALQRADPPVDLVILDLVLPGGGAAIFELLKAVRPEIKVLVSSGYSPDEDQAKALTSRADGFLPKPYEIAELRQAVARALGRAA
jgi:PAS domain S-box-containing protein